MFTTVTTKLEVIYCRKLSAASGDHLLFISNVLVIARSKIMWYIIVKGHKIIEMYTTNRPYIYTAKSLLPYVSSFLPNSNRQQNINIKVHIKSAFKINAMRAYTDACR